MRHSSAPADDGMAASAELQSNMKKFSTLSLFLLLFLFLCRQSAYAQTPPDTLKMWGLEALNKIETDFALPERSLYAGDWKRDQTKPGGPSVMWDCGVQLTALTAAAKLDPTHYEARLRRFVKGMDVYWSPGDNKVWGYDVLPGPKQPDRYYDDNEWVCLGLCEAYEVTKEAAYRDRAEAVFIFVMSGEDAKLDGGLYWHEQEKKSKNACSNGPAAAAALRLYQITHKPKYLEIGKRLYAWMNAHLQDTDGLYWDNIRLDGRVEKTKWSYNTALMLRANCLLYEITKEAKYIDEAERLARASEAHWVKADTGAIADGGAFAHLLSESFLYLAAQDSNDHWTKLVNRALTFVYDKARDTEGRYGDHWDQPVATPIDKTKLLPQASVARAFLIAAQLP